MNLRNKKIVVTGGAGFLGSFVVKKLLKNGVLEKNISIPRSKNCDLRDPANCKKTVKDQNIIIHLAGSVGGIGYNQKNPGTLFYDNIIMGIQLMEAARNAGVEKFVTIGTICSYPKFTPMPFHENNLWNGYPEETNAPYGLAKKILLVQGQAYQRQYNFNVIHLLPVNLYGPGDNFDPVSSHVIPALIRKIEEAKRKKKEYIDVWGTGKATREFLYIEDAAKGIVLATNKYNGVEPVNIGAGMEISIKNLVELICNIMEFKGEIKWDTNKPDGQPRRYLDVTRAKKEFDFEAKTNFETGLKKTIEWYLSQNNQLK